MWTIPNILTLSRLVFIPLIIYYCHTKQYELAIAISLFSSLSDFFDGYLARKLNQETKIGALLDPVADKFFEIILILYLFHFQGQGWNIVFLAYAVCLTTRNLTQLSVFPVLMWWKKIEFKVEPKMPAKIASAFGMIIINFYIILKYFFQFIQESRYSEETMNLLRDIQFTGGIVCYLLIAIGVLFELYMLFTFIPRYRKVYLGEHDTFN